MLAVRSTSAPSPSSQLRLLAQSQQQKFPSSDHFNCILTDFLPIYLSATSHLLASTVPSLLGIPSVVSLLAGIVFAGCSPSLQADRQITILLSIFVENRLRLLSLAYLGFPHRLTFSYSTTLVADTLFQRCNHVTTSSRLIEAHLSCGSRRFPSSAGHHQSAFT